ncbi:3-beta hydroxysteroid dehydrogenase [Micromonospora sp. LAH09]|uniref:SDR family oxidoreductase n=1 Tax=Micromonospora cabrerizensis TaxID=2911213 RepID=UPI001EE79555|nr:3-beta hydroxysteroid dehydrogenase [Micromonospora cabrerizensis]MCG5468265.1 3-beta hydroxysteroid dehydrogenase [Micromonospora cabrerizensis]
MRIAVAGGTGWVGRLVVDAVRATGHEPVILARSTGVDLVRGSGLDEALTGVPVVIDVSNTSTVNRKTSENFFGAATGNLLAAGQRVGVRHHVALSVVGADRVNWGYYAGKRLQEKLVLDGAVPATVLRSTQFHELAAQMLATIPGPVAVVPQMLSQPIAAHEVAHCLVDLALADPSGRAPEIAGPQQLHMPDMARRLLRARGRHRVVLPVRLPGATGRAMAGGGLLPTGPGPRGKQTFDQWLASSAAQHSTGQR